jgi:endonuclease/exonuclease/phosphatase family metal-dependent hydrolase
MVTEWGEVEELRLPGLPSGRAVSGSTETPVGILRVLGVCIPWHMAGARYADPKRKQWDVHIEFLEALAVVLKQNPGFDVVAGDFNQMRPRAWGSKVAEQKLLEALAGFTIATEAPLSGCLHAGGVDHIAIASDFEAIESFGWPNKVGDQRFSDHEGAGIVVALKDRT